MDYQLVTDITVGKIERARKRGVKVFVIIEDLNCYLNQEHLQRLEDCGTVVVRNNRIKKFYKHIMNFHPLRFFNRNH
jgi:phosphatidylserine/phosphatidylglycerophosphate/cardiolipin synthase-like enzyme